MFAAMLYATDSTMHNVHSDMLYAMHATMFGTIHSRLTW